MTIDLRNVIGDDSALRSGGFAGAVFLTYTLNLTFFEQMIAPKLDQAGCINVLILADPDGYQRALELGLQTISDAGMRYVCAPLLRTGQGVQHAKILLMAGAKRGRLLIGSGNLTMHGFGRNLEIYSHFEFDLDHDTEEQRYPFVQVWDLINKLVTAQEMSRAGMNQIQIIRATAPWLEIPAPAPVDFRIWHNHDQTTLHQLIAWREERGLAGQPVHDIRVISPYYDQDAEAISKLSEDLLPDEIQIHLDPNLTNLDGSLAANRWQSAVANIGVKGIGPGSETSKKRHVHAKAIIGREANGAWCIAGSANLTRPALLRTWQNGGNLEAVTFQWSDNPAAFDYLLEDSIVQVWPLSLDQVRATETGQSEQTNHQDTGITIVDLISRSDYLEGKVSRRTSGQEARIHLLRSTITIPVDLKQDLSFHVQLSHPLEGAEAARLEMGSIATPYRWIDQPDMLARFGARTYQTRIKGKIESIPGAESLFQELMNYLWERVEPEETDAQDPRRARISRKKQGDEPTTQDVPPPPGPEDFIMEEEDLVRTLHWATGHQQPYDRHLLSLRDLLSLVLLRLTTPTQVTLEISDGETRDESADQNRQAEQEVRQIKALERLRDYLISYCKRYGRRLVDPEFLRGKYPGIIFQNHVTLSRVLLEFHARASAVSNPVFTSQDLSLCSWWIWAPLVWPEIIGLNENSALILLEKEHGKAQIHQAWRDAGMAEAGVMMFCEFLGRPLNWEAGLRNDSATRVFLTAREWINRTKKAIGEDAFSANPDHVEDIYGIRAVEDISGPHEYSLTDDYLSQFTQLEQYLPPIQEKYEPLAQVYGYRRSGTPTPEALIEEIHRRGLENEFEAFKRRPAPILAVPENEPYCPRCGAHQTRVALNALERGGLVLCTSSNDAWIYYRPKLPKTVI